MPEAHEARAGVAGRAGRKGCPPHGPYLIDAVDEVLSYAARCLRCGLVGPLCKDFSEAKVAFDQRWP